MAGNEIKLTLRVDDNGSLNIVAKQAKAAASATDQLDKSTKNASKSRSNYQKVEKGVGQAGLSTAKGFSKQAGAITGGLVPAYAVLAANVFALTALFGALQRASAIKQLEEGLIAVGTAAGQNLPFVADNLRQITDLAISSEQAMRATAVAMSAGFNSDQLERLTKVAKGASLALGRDMGDALDRLVRGTAKLEPEILDELGIMVRLDDATTTYAASIGKSVANLTRFERQQAFLNATLEQGEAKFNRIAESVETNPYNKLEASFNNLTKTVLNALNTGLTPLVETLASAPTALFGAALAFGSGLARSVLPTLTDMAEKQNILSASAVEGAKKAREIAVKEYGNISSSIASMDFAPASLKDSAKQYSDGARSAADMQKDVNNLKKSESLRAVALKSYAADSAKYSTEFVLQKQRELESVTGLKNSIIALQQQEAMGGGTSAAEAYANNALQQSDVMAGALGKMGGGIASDFKIASSASKDLFGELNTVQGGFNKTKATAKAAGKSVKLFGTALVGAVPIVGQVIFAIGLLQPLFEKLFGDSDLEKTIKDVNKSFESLAKTSVFYAKVLADDTIPQEEKLQASLLARIGIMNQLSGALKKVQEAEDVERTEKIAKAQRNLTQAIKDQGQEIVSGPLGQVRYIDATDIARAQKVLQGFYAESDKLNVANAKSVLMTMQTQIRGTGALAEDSAEQLALIDSVISRLEPGAKNQIKTNSQLNKEIEDGIRIIQNVKSAQDGLTESTKNANKESRVLADKVATPYTKALDAVRDFNKSIKTIKLGKDGLKILDKSQVKQLDIFAERMGAAFDIIPAGGITPEDLLEAAVAKAGELEEEIATAAATAKTLTAEAKVLKDSSKNNAAIMQRVVDLEKEALEAKRSVLTNSLTLLEATTDEKDTTIQRAKLTREIAALTVTIADDAGRNAKVTQARLGSEKRISDAMITQKQTMLDIIEANDKLSKRKLAISDPNRTTGITAEEELAILNKSYTSRKGLESEMVMIRLRAVDIEYDLIDARFALERIRMEGDLKRAGIEDTASLAALDRARQASQLTREAAQELILARAGVTGIKPQDVARDDNGAVITTPEAQPKAVRAAIAGAVSETDVAQTELEKTILAEKREAILGSIQSLQDKANATGNTALALAKEKNAIEQERKNIIANNAQLSLDAAGQLIVKDTESADAQKGLVELENLRTKAIQNSIAARELEVEAITRTQGKTAGSFADFQAQIATLQEEGGALAEGSTSTFSEKIAAVGEASQGLISHLKTLGPEGEYMGAVVGAAFKMSEGVSAAFEKMNADGATGKDKMMAAMQGVGAVISGIAAIQAAKSKAAVAGVDKEIEAEKRRDGKSQQSLAKIKQLEAKKEAIKKKAFEKDKKMKMAETVIATAAAIMKAAPNIPMMIFQGAMGAMQLAAIASSSYAGGGSPAGVAAQPSAITMGQRGTSTDLAKSKSAGGELAYFRGAQGQGGAENFRPAFTGAKYRANGGQTAGYVVGEQGPELFVPETPGTIVPNDGDGMTSAPANVNFSISALDASGVEDILTQQRGNIIGMIREAANSYGQDFVEGVDTSVYTPSAGGVSKY